MFRRNIWKLTLTLAIALWAVLELIPLRDRPFDDYVRGEVAAQKADFDQLLQKARDRVKNGQAPSVFFALKQISREARVDLARYFPGLNVGDVKNIERRNEILLNYLLKQSKSPLQLGLDLKGGVAFTLEASQEAAGTGDDYERRQKLAKAVEIIANRVNSLGVAEPIIRPVGSNRIEVQLANLSTRENPEVVNEVKKPARLEFRLVREGAGAAAEPPTEVPPGYEVMSLEEEDKHTGRTYTVYYQVKQLPEMTGETVKQALPTSDLYGGYQVHLNFNSEGAKLFGDVTTANVGRLLAIVLDGRLSSAPRINEPITGGTAQITGRFSAREAEQLATVLNNPLDLPLEVKEQYEVGPSLAQDAIDSGVKAAIIGAALVAAFMITFYTAGGLIAATAVSVNVLIILGVLASLGATLSMPGIAGVVLTIGMAVDAHILIFERMREELSLGKNLKAALHAGHDKAFTTIVDANLTTLITSGLMIAFGTGPVKGFGITLTIGIFSTMFTALVTSRMLLEMFIDSDVMTKFPMLSLLKSPKLDFVRYGKAVFLGSWLIVLVGLVAVVVKYDRIYGIDFVGGDDITLAFKQRVDTGQIRSALAGAKLGEVNPIYQSELAGGREVLKVQTEAGKGTGVVAALTQGFPQAGFEEIGKTTIGPTIGKEIQWNAFMSLGLAIVGIMLYVAFRFEIGYGIGAVISTIHDILMTIGIFVLTDRQFTAPMVAAILLIAGYSINDTIVVFDRIREELKVNPSGALRDIINLATNKVLTRSLLTSFTTFLAALALYLFGGGVINDLAFTFLVGIVTGTFSSIFVASPIFYWWHKGDRKHVEAHQDIAPKYEWAGSSRASQ